MLAAQSAPRFDGVSSSVKADIGDVLKSGQYYVTPDIARELGNISSNIDHIKLDNQLLATSREWGSKFDPATTSRQRQGASQAIDNAASALFDVKTRMDGRSVNNMQDNQLRQGHQWTVGKLQGASKDMSPFASESVSRLQQFCDHVGVTDRYNGYRNNLNRGSRDPVRLGFNWLDNKNRNAHNNTLNVGWKPPAVAQSAPAPFRSEPEEFRKVKSGGRTLNKCIQEQCGINTTFPGNTEYMVRYTRPCQTRAPDFKINPSPQFGATGRPLARLVAVPLNSEYQGRYEFPNGDKIVRLPWLRK